MKNRFDFASKIKELIKDPLNKKIYDVLITVTDKDVEIYHGLIFLDTDEQKKKLLELFTGYELEDFSTVLEMLLDIENGED